MKKLLAIIFYSLIFGVFPAYAMAATLSLSPVSGTFNKNCSFALDINLDTVGAQTDGTDAILLYDSSRFTATSISAGTIYSDYPGNNIDDAQGKVTVSGLASISQAFSGTGTLAKVNFMVKDTAPVGVSQIKFDFDANNKTKTTDSNVVERGTVADVLSSVTNGNYTIGSGTSCTAVAAGSPVVPGTGGGKGGVGGATPSAEVPIKTLPPAGTEQFTFTMVIVGSVLTVLGILGLALL